MERLSLVLVSSAIAALTLASVAHAKFSGVRSGGFRSSTSFSSRTYTAPKPSYSATEEVVVRVDTGQAQDRLRSDPSIETDHVLQFVPAPGFHDRLVRLGCDRSIIAGDDKKQVLQYGPNGGQ
ncbi:hypothetical protein QN224_12835 [Sinorhizobium sp. 8-89]|uniref:hypothetical protein n=1 Tax=Sinorhizobium sp. 7-81 TaxID=3049087 RepID=UPI0024C344FC|nr:hypothetical protein [Sinorhizobium sp. 7-81]MDK1386294.1 hypothetical protein [Sinorhizobium sp. 7-81]